MFQENTVFNLWYLLAYSHCFGNPFAYRLLPESSLRFAHLVSSYSLQLVLGDSATFLDF
jgi:hypothetical protein